MHAILIAMYSVDIHAMNISKIVDAIIELRGRGAAPDAEVAEYIKTLLEAGGANVEAQSAMSSAMPAAVAAAFLLSGVFLAGAIKRRHRAASVAALAVSLLLFFEFTLGWQVVSRPFQERSENIVAHFPVQDAARRVIMGAPYAEAAGAESGRFAKTVSAFLTPITLVMVVLGIWQLAVHFGKFDFEDAHTIMIIMGCVCVTYYALAFGTRSVDAMPSRGERKPGHNAGSIATLAALAEDLSQKYPRLRNTSVSVVFFGGGQRGQGARSFSKGLARERTGALPTYFIGCEQMGMGGPHAYVVPEDVAPNPLGADRELIRVLNRAAAAATGRPLEIVSGAALNSGVFADRGFPAAVLTTLSRDGRDGHNEESNPREIDRGQLLLSLQLLEAGLSEFDKPQFSLPQAGDSRR
jgi:hypothetical protein